MKRILCFVLTVLLLLCLCSCVNGEEVGIEESPNVNIEFWTDGETGVQYIIYDRQDGYAGFGGITPRLNSDGTIYRPTEVLIK